VGDPKPEIAAPRLAKQPRECEPTEHALLGDVGSVSKRTPHPRREQVIVGHSIIEMVPSLAF